MTAFPNPWLSGKGGDQGQGKGRGQKGKGKDRGKEGKRGKGQGVRGGRGDAADVVPTERQEALLQQLEALASGTETSAVPRTGDVVALRVLGSDRQDLHGRRGIVGVPVLLSLLHAPHLRTLVDEMWRL